MFATAKVIDTIRKLKEKGVAPKDIILNLRMSRLKPLALLFLVKAYKQIKSRPSLVTAAWARCGLLDALKPERQLAAMQLNVAGKLFPQAASKKQAAAERNAAGLMPGIHGNTAVAAEEANPIGSQEDASLDEPAPNCLPFDVHDDERPLQQLLTAVQKMQDEHDTAGEEAAVALAAAAAAADSDDEACADLLFEPSPAKKPRTEVTPAAKKKPAATKKKPVAAKKKPAARAVRVVAAVCDSEEGEPESEAESELSDMDDSGGEEWDSEEEEVVQLKQASGAARPRRVSAVAVLAKGK